MSVITFSTHFQKGHPREGQRTSFVEKIWSGLLKIDNDLYSDYLHPDGRPDSIKHADYYRSFDPKYHTIRAGSRFKVGDTFDPRIWTGKPYKSKQFQFAPRLTVIKTWDIEIDDCDVWAIGLPNEQIKYTDEDQESQIAINDGLTEQDLYWWFKNSKRPFNGQIICWNENIKY